MTQSEELLMEEVEGGRSVPSDGTGLGALFIPLVL